MKPNYIHLTATDFVGDTYEGLAVIINTNTDQRDEPYGNFALLQNSGKYHMGNYAWFHNKEAQTVPLTGEQEAHAESLYSKFQELHRTSPYKIIGWLYDTKPFFSDWDTRKEYPSYRLIPESKVEWRLKAKDATCIDNASEWLLKNHPDYWMGANIIQECPSGNFSMHAAPGAEYGRGNFETYAARNRFAKKEAKRRGVEVGPSEVVKES